MQWVLGAALAAAAAGPLASADADSPEAGTGALLRDMPIVRADLLRWRWTMFVGDSVLMGQFLSLAQELGAVPAEPALSSFEPCTNPETGGTWATGEAMRQLADLPHEYLVTCSGATEAERACSFTRVGCLNLYPRTCVVECHEACETTAEWERMVGRIQAVLAEPGGFAVSWHWAPAHLDHAMVLARLPAFVPGRVLWNNCHHWFGAVPGEPDPAKRDLWLQYVAKDALLLKQVVPSGVFFQGCGQLRCDAASSPCAASNAWLAGMTQSAMALLAPVGIPTVDPLPLLGQAVVARAFVDGRHPCYPVPCMWNNSASTAPRECCASLLRQAFLAMEAAPMVGGPIGALQHWGVGSRPASGLF